MKLIIDTSSPLDNVQRQVLSEIAQDVFASSIFPFACADIDDQDLHKLGKLEFVKSWRKERECQCATPTVIGNRQLVMKPTLEYQLLQLNKMAGEGVRIIILDSGVNASYEKETEIMDFTGDGVVDKNGHGEIVHKIIKSICPRSEILLGKIANTKSFGESYALRGLEWALKKGADIINASWVISSAQDCSKGKTCYVCRYMDALADRGVIVVTAAGNWEPPAKRFPIKCPAKHERTIAVGSVSESRKSIAAYSCCGDVEQNKPDLVAPGHIVYNGYPHTGTSFSAPCVTGILAAIMGKVKDSTKARDLLFRSLADLNLPSCEQGCGCVNIRQLIDLVHEVEKDENAAHHLAGNE